MKKQILKLSFIAIFIMAVQIVFAHEGMWIPSTLAKLVEGDMQNAGLKISAEEIYSINNSSLKDAIVHFGGGCTASVISEEGMILTNHHCGYSQIQSHSTLENDYLTHGFWAMKKSDELRNPNLTATFVVRIEDVTERIMSRIANLDEEQKQMGLAIAVSEIESEAINGNHYNAEVKSYFYGNAYYLIVTETFRDVRLVGTPPSSIGKFGGDTDNWSWPRHTGDFALFRIYAGTDNKPADYSIDNIPYKPKHSLSINMDGLAPGDFTMVFGFPGRTDQYLTSYAVKYITEVENPMRIEMRKASLSVIDRAMENSDKTRIQYAAKQSRISNAYKKWIGQNMGLERYDAVGQKIKQEEAFAEAVSKNSRYNNVKGLLGDFETLYANSQQYQLARAFLVEFYYFGPEAIRFSNNFKSLSQTEMSEERRKKEIEKLEKSIDGFFKDFDAIVDRDVMAVLLPLYNTHCPDIIASPTLKSYSNKYKDAASAAAAIYKESIFADKANLLDFLKKPAKKQIKTLERDPIFKIGSEMLDMHAAAVRLPYEAFVHAENELMQVYVKTTMELFPQKKYWPDANSSLRLTYGAMEGSEPQDGLQYKAYTTLEGIVQKYIPGDKEFDAPEKLLQLEANRDYGRYATDGEMRVNFLGSNHTTGGNSGSPALDAHGYLVGLNFDRTWESTMSDIMFNGEICRNIMVDAKYVLFIIDKYANAGHLVDEMNLVYPSKLQTKQKDDSEQKAG